MSETNQLNSKVDITNETNIEQSSSKQKKTRTKKERNTVDEDAYLISDASKVKSLKAIIENRVVEILKEEPLLNEKELLIKLIARDDKIKEYFARTQDLSYLKFVIWDLAKKKIILKAKVLGDRKHTYFFLPSQLDLIKDKIIKAPKK